MSNLLHFEWTKDRDGYDLIEFDPAPVDWWAEEPHWEVAPPSGATPDEVRLLRKWGMGLRPDPRSEPKPFLMLEPVGDQEVRYRPLDQYPGLCMDFSRLRASPADIKSFAKSYGQLRAGKYPDSPEAWYPHIQRMKTAVKLWKQGKAAGSLREWTSVFNIRLSGIIGAQGRSMASIRLVDTDDPLQPLLQVVPEDLLSAMWLQLAQHVSSSKGLRQCAHCSKWFEHGTGTGRRRTGHYCEDKCRKAHWTARNQKKPKGPSRSKSRTAT